MSMGPQYNQSTSGMQPSAEYQKYLDAVKAAQAQYKAAVKAAKQEYKAARKGGAKAATTPTNTSANTADTSTNTAAAAQEARAPTTEAPTNTQPAPTTEAPTNTQPAPTNTQSASADNTPKGAVTRPAIASTGHYDPYTANKDWTDEEVADQIISGNNIWGNGDERKKNLGTRYQAVQDIINKKLTPPPATEAPTNAKSSSRRPTGVFTAPEAPAEVPTPQTTIPDPTTVPDETVNPNVLQGIMGRAWSGIRDAAKKAGDYYAETRK